MEREKTNMYKFMKKIPGGLLLVPMIVSAIINTIDTNNVLSRLGGATNALLTQDGINYIIGAVCFCSGATISIKKLFNILKKQGVLILVKTAVVVALGMLFISLFGNSGVFGVAAITFIAIICSTNPALYLSLVGDYGTEEDQGAFGLIGLMCVPAYPLLIFGISQRTQIDWTPIISTLIPILLGMLIGNLDKDMAAFFRPGLAIFTPLMGWAFGASINIIDAFQAGLIGIVLMVVFYLVNLPALYTAEKKLLKSTGVSAAAMTSVAGLSVSVPALAAQANPELLNFVPAATAQIAMVVVLTSVLTPIITRWVAKRNGVTGPSEAEVQKVN